MNSMGLGLGMSLSNSTNFSSSFVPSSLGNLISQVPFDEGSSLVARNLVGRTVPYINLVPQADTLNGTFNSNFNATWGTNLITGKSDPFGGTAGIQWTSLGDTGTKLMWRTNNKFPAGTYTMSCYVISNTASLQTVLLDFGGQTTSMTAAVGTWTRYTVTATIAATNPTWGFRVNGAVACDVLLYGVQVEVGSSATTYQTPSFDWCLQNTVAAPAWANGGVNPGGSSFFSGGSLSTSDYTIYLAAKQNTSPTSGETLFADTLGTSYHWLSLSTFNGNSPGISMSGTLDLPARTNVGKYQVHCWVQSASSVQRWLRDGVEEMNIGEVAMLLDSQSNGLRITGESGYMLIYNATHTLLQIRQVSNWIISTLQARAALVDGVPTKRIVWTGDSITIAYPGITSRGVTGFPPPVRQTVYAVAGNGTQQVQAYLPDIQRGWSPAAGAKNLAMVWIGTNDGANLNQTAAWSYANMINIVTTLQGYGFKVALGTCLPRTAIFFNGANSATFAIFQAALNTLIRANTAEADYIVDYASDAIMGNVATCADLTYYLDQVHPTQAGYDLLYPYASAVMTTAGF